MTDEATRDLPGEVAALRDEVARLRARVGGDARGRRGVRRHPRRPAVLALALLLALLPYAALAVTFSDRAQFSPSHAANIGAIADAGITVGFDDPASADPDVRLYNAKGNVTREEMATFLAKTAGLGTFPPVANAKTAQTAVNATNATNAQTAVNATSAANADRLGGKGAGDLARVARGASAFDSLASPATAFTPPADAVYPTFVAVPGAAVTVQAPADGFVLVSVAVVAIHRSRDLVFIRVRDTTPGAPATAVSPTIYQHGNRDGGVAPLTDTLALSWIFPVTGAGAKTFALEVSHIGGNASDSAYANDALTALYVPFGFAGGTTLAP